MQTNILKRVHKNKKRMTVGRGSKRGKTSGRGGKGQTARAGHKVRPEIRDMIKRVPKLRGRGKNIFQSFKPSYTPVNLNMLEKHFSEAEKITSESLVSKGLAELVRGNQPLVKILAEGEVTKKLTIVGCSVSVGAREKIEKAGGSVVEK